MQLELQTKKMKDGDPRNLEGVELMTFLTWNSFALTDELHEAMAEVGWKPWATNKYVHREQFVKEMVDAWHFFMNLLLAVSPGMTPLEITDDFVDKYMAKNAVNAKRQEDGYDGKLGKCEYCHRDLGEVPGLPWSDRFCTAQHELAFDNDLKRNLDDN